MGKQPFQCLQLSEPWILSHAGHDSTLQETDLGRGEESGQQVLCQNPLPLRAA